MAFDLMAGLGRGFSNVAPAIQMLMMLQEAKAEREARDKEHSTDLASRERDSKAARDLQLQIAQMEENDRKRREFTEPLQRQGMYVDQPAYDQAATVEAPNLQQNFDVDPARLGMRTATDLTQNAGDAQQRLQALRTKAAQALQAANKGGPGAVQTFEGGMAIGQAPFPTQSQSTSTSYSGVAPDQLRLRELDTYTDALGRFVSNAINNYRVVNPYGGKPGDEQRITQDAIAQFETMWPSIRKQIMGDNKPVSGAGGGTTTESNTVTGPDSAGQAPFVTQPRPNLPQNPTDPRFRYRHNLRRGF